MIYYDSFKNCTFTSALKMTQTKNIIFDLGGVLLNLDFSKTTNAFRDLGFPHFEEMFSQYKVDQLFEKLEKGEITEAEFYTVMLNVGNNNITEEEIRHAWNSMILDYRTESLNFLRELKKDYRLILLSNTNSIHYEAFHSILKKQLDLDSLNGFFSNCYYSHLVGFRKPNNDVFDFVLNDAGILAEETFFIDDTSNNILAAKKMGFKTHLLLPGEKIETLEYLVSSGTI